MDGSYADKYAFTGEWFDAQASLIYRFNIFYFPVDDTVEIYDVKHKKTFMRRMKVSGVALSDFYVGANVFIHGRIIKITGFACKDTQHKLGNDIEVTFGLMKPMPMGTVGKVLSKFYEAGLKITRIKMAYLTLEDVEFIYGPVKSDPSYTFLVEHVRGRKNIGFGLVGKNAIEVSMKIAGHKNPKKALPNTIRALYGTDRIKNCLYLASSPEEARKSLDYFFNSRIGLTPSLSNCTLCLIKPHAWHKMSDIISLIDENGFEITALNSRLVEKENAAEFYEVYKGILPEYQGMVDDLASGPCIAMEIVSKDKSLNCAVEFRKFVGPFDPELGRMLRPNTLRAKFGTSKVKNAVHCSDLPEDGLLEVEYFFKILAI